MEPFLLGLILGAGATAVCVGAVYVALQIPTYPRPDDWLEEHYQRVGEPPAVTRVMIHERKIEL